MLSNNKNAPYFTKIIFFFQPKTLVLQTTNTHRINPRVMMSKAISLHNYAPPLINAIIGIVLNPLTAYDRIYPKNGC